MHIICPTCRNEIPIGDQEITAATVCVCNKCIEACVFTDSLASRKLEYEDWLYLITNKKELFKSIDSYQKKLIDGLKKTAIDHLFNTFKSSTTK